MRRGKQMQDLFQDLRDGQNLITLLEMLSGQNLPRERGRMRVHQLQNIQIALNYIKFRKVKLVNIRPEDIADGNQKLTLGLIWTIILHFQVSRTQMHTSVPFSLLLLAFLLSLNSPAIGATISVALTLHTEHARHTHTTVLFPNLVPGRMNDLISLGVSDSLWCAFSLPPICELRARPFRAAACVLYHDKSRALSGHRARRYLRGCGCRKMDSQPR